MGEVGVEGVLQRHGIQWEPSGQVLSVQGRRINLDSRSVAVLQELAVEFGKRVSKDALLAAAWPNQVIHENSLAKAISRLRRALEGSGLEIVASYGVGYVLRGASSELRAKGEETSPAEVSPPDPDSIAMSLSPMRLAIFGSVFLLIAAIGLFLAVRDTNLDIAVRDGPPITSDPPGARATILWVDDNPSNNRLEVAFLKQKGIAVHLAETTDDALNLLKINDYRLVVSDLGRGDDRLAGLKMTRAMKQGGLSAPVIIYTIRPDDPDRQQEQRKLIASYGVRELAVTPQEVRAKVLARIEADTAAR